MQFCHGEAAGNFSLCFRLAVKVLGLDIPIPGFVALSYNSMLKFVFDGKTNTCIDRDNEVESCAKNCRSLVRII